MTEAYTYHPSPNDSPKDGTMHPMALQQLAQWQAACVDWPRYPDGRAIRCGKCDQALWLTYDPQGQPFRYEDDELFTLIVAHVRQRHPEALYDNAQEING